MGPVVITVAAELQESIVGSDPRIPELVVPAPPQGEAAAVREAARMLVASENPLIQIAKLGRTPKAWDLLIELAETLQAPVDTMGYSSWQKFPSWHPLYGTGGRGYTPDVTIGLEVTDMSAQARAARAANRKTISISAEHLFQGSNIHDYGRYADVDLAIAADAEATLPALIEAVTDFFGADFSGTFDARRARLAEAHRQARERNRVLAAHGWDASPLSTARIAAELWEQIKNKDWSLVSRSDGMSDWAWRLWDFDKYHHHIGQSGSLGIGYSNPAAVGAALANRKYGRLSINLQNDGDFLFLPSTLWTAAHHQIPMLTVMHNNRAWHQELMFVEYMCGVRGRGTDRGHIGTTLRDPFIDYRMMAACYGMAGEGPITDPVKLGPALKRGVASVKKGMPYMIDVITQPR